VAGPDEFSVSPPAGIARGVDYARAPEISVNRIDHAEWVDELRPGAVGRERALARLHALLVRAARAEAGRRGRRLGIAGPELDDLAHEAAGDALLAILAKLDQFRGESRFVTWAYKFVVLEVAQRTTRHAWRRAAPLREPADWEQLPDRFGFAPGEALQWRELFAELRRGVEHDLTAHQRRVFEAIVLHQVPLDVLVDELGSTRGAIYKTLFDARRKLRARLAANGYMDDLGTLRA
jgi:RNA polymerase sigma-70 factor (ECF subfamily)